ncbi:Putative nuclease HARBI1 [Eumeta japonica]|uniref:Nuclease HARBI1 n=1 Tax=Eumeta variegata TaxID=151549 RepID=A0A4C1U8U3_EUMVA|nr:Putative nuclease HARBI1 [Eumeta japonica]
MHSLRLLWAAQNEEVWLRRKRNASRRCLKRIGEMPDALFREQFRLNKQTFDELCLDLRNHTALRGTREIPVEIKVLCALSFLATGSYQKIVGMTQHLPQRTTSRCIRQVVDALNSHYMSSKWIVFPQTRQERSRIRQEFQRRFHIPGVIGCIDCTHIALIRPNENEHQFYNRKGYHSLNVQMICDYDLKIINVNAKYGGATHDALYWQLVKFNHICVNYIKMVNKLGDSGYPQRAWLMTPISNAVPGSQEEIYTKRHILARNCIERCFGLLKARWRCLLKHRTLHYHPHVATKIIVACCILHNIALDARLPPPSDTTEYHDGNMAEQHDDHNVSEQHDNPNVIEVNSSNPNNQEDLICGRAMLRCLVDRM